MRVNAGGDFCSREHRNQYRLRRSMECLTEANKVATLARRRENPKPLASAAPVPPDSSRRPFLESPEFSPRQVTPMPARLTPGIKSDAERPKSGPVRLGLAAGIGGTRRQFGLTLPAKRPPVARLKGVVRLGAEQQRARRFAELAPPAERGAALRAAASVPFPPSPRKAHYGQRPGIELAAKPAGRMLGSEIAPVPGRATERLVYGALAFAANPEAATANWVLTPSGRDGGRSIERQ
jgi:hypothetical protein